MVVEEWAVKKQDVTSTGALGYFVEKLIKSNHFTSHEKPLGLETRRSKKYASG